MTREDSPTFEALRRDLATAPPASVVDERRISWVGQNRRLAFARDTKGQLEVFLVGGPLLASELVVRKRLVHNSWETHSGGRLSANRIWLPAGDHYDAIGATLLIELIDNGFEGDQEQGFRRTEPLLALVLGQAESESAALTGLAGELLTLASLIRSKAASPPSMFDAWQGWGRSSRDFQLGVLGVEVKTSTTGASRHHIQGWYQVECGVAADGAVETGLYLLSIGIQWLAVDSHGLTIEGLVQEVLATLPLSRRHDFLEAVRNYCELQLLIDEDGNAGQSDLRRPFISTFERMYDMQDERVRVPASADLARFAHVVSDTVAFEIELPERVRGDRNPHVGMGACVAVLMSQCGWS